MVFDENLNIIKNTTRDILLSFLITLATTKRVPLSNGGK